MNILQELFCPLLDNPIIAGLFNCYIAIRYIFSCFRVTIEVFFNQEKYKQLWYDHKNFLKTN